MVEQEFNLSVTPIGNPIQIHLNKDDSDFRLIFNIESRSGDFTMEDYTTARICGTKPDGSKYQATASISVSNKKVTVNGDRNMTNVSGIGLFEICLIHSGKELFTQNFKVYIENI